ncbi:hypothetical protein BZG36_01591 [Bifiguratus adelaidae]|uniref:Uncharacterized protein n=1 Tax=Bifiguratus adelaidae TaxID=1938954 RepID=A0A261Y3Y1_9FUNG|nr:hypothetical protein BZG36_01591 [Bifiguratus adelaidae]
MRHNQTDDDGDLFPGVIWILADATTTSTTHVPTSTSYSLPTASPNAETIGSVRDQELIQECEQEDMCLRALMLITALAILLAVGLTLGAICLYRRHRKAAKGKSRTYPYMLDTEPPDYDTPSSIPLVETQAQNITSPRLASAPMQKVHS